MLRSARSRFLAVLFVSSIAWSLPVSAQAPSMSEPALKAQFLFNFAKFTDWPADLLAPTAPITLCVTDGSVETELQAIAAGHSIGQHPLTVARVKLDESARSCTVLYAGKIDSKKEAQLITLLAGTSTLTVGDAEDFAVRGGMIGLFVDEGRMRFAVNRDAVQRTRLKLSSQLLTLAKLVKQ